MCRKKDIYTTKIWLFDITPETDNQEGLPKEHNKKGAYLSWFLKGHTSNNILLGKTIEGLRFGGLTKEDIFNSLEEIIYVYQVAKEKPHYKFMEDLRNGLKKSLELCSAMQCALDIFTFYSDYNEKRGIGTSIVDYELDERLELNEYPVEYLATVYSDHFQLFGGASCKDKEYANIILRTGMILAKQLLRGNPSEHYWKYIKGMILTYINWEDEYTDEILIRHDLFLFLHTMYRYKEKDLKSFVRVCKWLIEALQRDCHPSQGLVHLISDTGRGNCYTFFWDVVATECSSQCESKSFDTSIGKRLLTIIEYDPIIEVSTFKSWKGEIERWEQKHKAFMDAMKAKEESGRKEKHKLSLIAEQELEEMLKKDNAQALRRKKRDAPVVLSGRKKKQSKKKCEPIINTSDTASGSMITPCGKTPQLSLWETLYQKAVSDFTKGAYDDALVNCSAILLQQTSSLNMARCRSFMSDCEIEPVRFYIKKVSEQFKKIKHYHQKFQRCASMYVFPEDISKSDLNSVARLVCECTSKLTLPVKRAVFHLTTALEYLYETLIRSAHDGQDRIEADNLMAIIENEKALFNNTLTLLRASLDLHIKVYFLRKEICQHKGEMSVAKVTEETVQRMVLEETLTGLEQTVYRSPKKHVKKSEHSRNMKKLFALTSKVPLEISLIVIFGNLKRV